MVSVQVMLFAEVVRRTTESAVTGVRPRVCRRLFDGAQSTADADPMKFLKSMETQLRRDERDRWNFDFENEAPLPGRYDWVPVCKTPRKHVSDIQSNVSRSLAECDKSTPEKISSAKRKAPTEWISSAGKISTSERISSAEIVSSTDRLSSSESISSTNKLSPEEMISSKDEMPEIECLMDSREQNLNEVKELHPAGTGCKKTSPLTQHKITDFMQKRKRTSPDNVHKLKQLRRLSSRFNANTVMRPS